MSQALKGNVALRAGREAGIDPICHTLVGAGLARSGLARRTALGTTHAADRGQPPRRGRAGLLLGTGRGSRLPPRLDPRHARAGAVAVRAERRHAAPGPRAHAGSAPSVARRRAVAPASCCCSPPSPSSRTPPSTRSTPTACAGSCRSAAGGSTATRSSSWIRGSGSRWAIGVILSRPARGITRPARIALWVSLAYASAMAVSGSRPGRWRGPELAAIYGRGAGTAHGLTGSGESVPAERGRRAGRDLSHWRRFAGWTARTWNRPRCECFLAGQLDHPAVQAAAATTLGRRFLGWARFPAFQVEPAGGNDYVVHIVDLRYADRPGVSFGSVSIPVGATDERR